MTPYTTPSLLNAEIPDESLVLSLQSSFIYSLPHSFIHL